MTEIINPIFKNIIIEKNNTSFFECFINTTSLFLFIPIAVFSLGLCATGVPIIILIPAIGGIISGLYVGYLYATYAMQGLGYAALIIIPAAAIIIGTLLKCCVESIFMSLEIIVSITSKAKNNSNRNELKEYCLKFLVFLIPFVLAGLINTTCFKLFGSLFSFVT
ncbi:MAG: stage II sporulation protein M [Clostridia bacterium]|nr:stage II sporulation protein M [Clostridia bacterium]